MVVIPGLSGPLEGVGKHVRTWDDSGRRLVVEVAGDAPSATCPQCGRTSFRRHGRYWRWIADCPSFGQPVTLVVEMQRFKCGNPACSQRTFSERVEALAAAGRRRTTRLAEALRALGYALGGQAASRLAARLGMRISGPTVLRELRELRRAGCAPSPVISTVIGIDDWALARGHRYGTIVVDLERRRPIDLLAERDGVTVKAWLDTQPHIEIVARDRGGAYAEAVRTAVSDALQVADRWHLLSNLRDAVERLLMRCTSKLREAAQQQANEVLPIEPTPPPVMPAEPILTAAQRHSKARRQHRLERYEEVVRRHGNGESIRAIGLSMNIDRRTVRGFVRAGTFPEQARRGPRTSLLDAHRAYLESRIAAGCRNAMQVWRELRARGFTGGRSIVRAAFAQLQVAGGDRRLDVCRTSAPSTRRACAWVLGW